jgi:replicative DNA helicase
MSPTEQQIPQDVTSEKALLSCLLQDPRLISEVPVHMFWIASHRIIYEALERLIANFRVKTIDFPVVKTEIANRGQTEDAGGTEYLNEIWGFLDSPSVWAYYLDNLDLVRRHREAVMGAMEIQSAGTAEEAIATLQKLSSVPQFVQGSMRHIKDVLRSLPDFLEERAMKRSPVVQFGIPELDKAVWVGRGSQVVICAETGGGKTSLAAQAVAATQTRKWAIFSLEMESEAIVARIAANVGSIALHRLYRGELLPNEWISWKEVGEDLTERHVWMDDRQFTVSQIAAICRNLQKSQGLDAIVVDYLQLVTPSDRKKESRQEQVAEISRSLKNLAMELKIAVITMSQLNDEGRLRESRAIGQDADVVLRITEKEISIDKHRNGARGSIPIKFVGEFVRFEELTKSVKG